MSAAKISRWSSLSCDDAAAFPGLLIRYLDRSRYGISFNYPGLCGSLKGLVATGANARERAEIAEIDRQWSAHIDTRREATRLEAA